MPSVSTIVFMHLPGGPVPAGRLTMTREPRASFATFAYGRRYLERDRAPVDPVQLPIRPVRRRRTPSDTPRPRSLRPAADVPDFESIANPAF